MKNLKLSRVEFLLTAVLFTCLNCSKGTGSDGTADEGNTLVLNVEPGLLNQETRRLPGALEDITAEDSESEVKADSGSDVGSELLGHLSTLSDTSVPLEEVELRIQGFLDSLGEESFSQAHQNLHKKDVETKLRHKQNTDEIVKNYGGESAVAKLKKYKIDSERLIQAHTQELDALVSSILTSRNVIEILFDAKDNRSKEVQDLKNEISTLQKTIQHAVAEQRKAYEAKIPNWKQSYDSISTAIEDTRVQIAKVETEYLKAVAKAKQDQNLWQWLWMTESGITKEVLNQSATAKSSWDLTQDRKKEMAALQQKRDALLSEWSTQRIQAATPPAQLTQSLKAVQAKLDRYQREVGLVFKEKEDLYRVGDNVFASLTEINEEIHSTLKEKKAKQLELAELDPVKSYREEDGTLRVEQSDETLEEDLKLSAARVVQKYRADIALAFKDKLKRYTDLTIDLDFAEADYQTEKAKVSQQYLNDQEKVKQDNQELSHRLREVALCYREVLKGHQTQESIVDSIFVDEASLLAHVNADLSEDEFKSVIYFLLDGNRQIVSIQTQRGLGNFISPLSHLKPSVYYMAVCTQLNDGTVDVQSRRLRFQYTR